MLERDLVLPHAIVRAAERSPDALAAAEVTGRRVTFAELAEVVRRWAAALAGLGVSAGDRVLTMVPNSFEAYYGWLGAAWLRAIEVPLNTMYRGQMLAYVANNSDAEVAVVSERFLDRVGSVAGELSRLWCLVVPDASGPLPELPFTVLTLAEFLADHGPVDGGDGPEYYDTAAMIYTSGTTGPSKGVLVPWAEMHQFATSVPADLLDPGRGYFSASPPFHVVGKALLYETVLQDGFLLVRETFSPAEFWGDVRRFDCQAAFLIGPAVAMLMASPPDPSDLDNPLESVGAGPLIPEIDGFMARFGVRVCTGYGMTEIGAPLISDGWNLANNRSCGRRRDSYQVRIVDDHDEPVPSGHVGELVVRSDEPWLINAGYWRMDDKTAAAWRNGWFHTGDAFMEDEDGNFYFVDRLKDAIRRRGENISSFEVEAGINSHSAVAESAAIGVPSELGEEDVKVVIVLHPGAELEPAQLIEWLVPRMPRFMIPRYVEFCDALPKTEATMRVQKASLRASPITERTWDREKAGVILPPA